MPPLVTTKFIRKPFAVDAIQVSAQNLRDVSRWCRGQIRTGDSSIFGPPGTAPTGVKVKFIKVPVKRPLNDRQTMAQAGDWVVSQGSGHKVYTDKAFQASFDEFVDQTMEELEQEAAEEKAEEDKPVLETVPVTPSDVFQEPRSFPLGA